MEEIENLEGEVALQSWFTTRGKNSMAAIFPGMCLSKIEKNKVRSDSESFNDRQNYFKNAGIVDLLSYKAIHLPISVLHDDSDEDDKSFEFGDGEFGEYITTTCDDDDENNAELVSKNSMELESTNTQSGKEEIKMETNKEDNSLNLEHSSPPFESKGSNKKIDRKLPVDRKKRKPTRLQAKKKKLSGKRKGDRKAYLFPCTQCSRRFIAEYLLENHIRFRHVGDPLGFHCPECPKKFKASNLLRVHIVKKHINGDKEKISYMCEFCGAVYATPDSLRSHKIRKGCGPENPYKCHLCGYILQDEPSHKNHEQQHESFVTTFPFHCVLCSEISKSSSELRFHVSRFHDTTLNKYKCKICKAGFQNFYALKDHELRHETGNSLKFQCNVCGHCSKSKYDARVHSNVHLENRVRHQCSQCSASYYRKNHLRLHVEKAHLAPNPYRFPCSICGKAFMELKTLNTHEYIHSGKKFPCPSCGKEFKAPNCLDQHRRGHCPVMNGKSGGSKQQ